MKALQKQRNKTCQLDGYWRKVEREKLDGYGWTMSLDSVRTPEEILLIKQRFERLERHIDRLAPRIGRVLRLRLGINCKAHTFDEIAHQYDITRERVRQMEAKGVRIIKRRIWIEEKPEDYRRECENVAKAYAERRRLEREAEMAELKARQDAPAIEAQRAWDERSWRNNERPREPDGRFVARTSDVGKARMPQHPRERTILHEIVKEQHRALKLERQYNSWATERAKWLRSPLPDWAQAPQQLYPYKLHYIPIKRDWLHVATEGFEHGA